MGKLDDRVILTSGGTHARRRRHAIQLAGRSLGIVAVDTCRRIALIRYPRAAPAALAQSARKVEGLERRVVTAQADLRDFAAIRAATKPNDVAELGPETIVLAGAAVAPLGAREDDPGPDSSSTTPSTRSTAGTPPATMTSRRSVPSLRLTRMGVPHRRRRRRLSRRNALQVRGREAGGGRAHLGPV